MEPTITLNADIWHKYRLLVNKGEDPHIQNKYGVILREQIVEAYIYLCKRVVAKMKKSMPAHVEREDLESLAHIGLLQAITRYDHKMGVPFEAFATQRMRSVIMDGIRDADWAPRSLRKKQRDINKLEDKIRQDEGREPTAEEVAAVIVTERLNEEGEELPSQEEFETLVLSAMNDVSTTKYESEIAAHTYIEGSLEAQNKPASLDEAEDELVYVLKTNAAKALKGMDIRKAAIVALHYYSELKLAKVAEILKMSEVKVGALHQEAVLEIWASLQEALADD